MYQEFTKGHSFSRITKYKADIVACNMEYFKTVIASLSAVADEPA